MGDPQGRHGRRRARKHTPGLRSDPDDDSRRRRLRNDLRAQKQPTGDSDGRGDQRRAGEAFADGPGRPDRRVQGLREERSRRSGHRDEEADRRGQGRQAGGRPASSTRRPISTTSGSSRSPNCSTTSTARWIRAKTISRRRPTIRSSSASIGSRRACSPTSRPPGCTPIADQLTADTLDLQKRIDGLTIAPKNLVGGSADLIEEVASKKIAGEEDRYSRTDLWDFQANVDGAQKIVSAPQSLIVKQDPKLSARLRENFCQGRHASRQIRTKDGGFQSYEKLTDPDRNALKGPVTALAEDLSALEGHARSRVIRGERNEVASRSGRLPVYVGVLPGRRKPGPSSSRSA